MTATATATATATTVAAPAIPAFYQGLAGYDFTRVSRGRAPVGALALIQDRIVAGIARYGADGVAIFDADRTYATVDEDTVAPIAGTDERHRFDLGHGFGAWLRTGEVLIRFAASGTAICAGQNRTCRKPLAKLICCWDHRITDGRYGDWMLGEDAFDHWRHADGTPCGDPHSGYAGGLEIFDSYAVPQCPDCHTYDSIHVRQEAYGDRITCTTDGCTYERWSPIGD